MTPTEQQLRDALNRAFQLGEKYWHQADHEFIYENKKAAETQKRFEQLLADTIAATSQQAEPAQQEAAGTDEPLQIDADIHNFILLASYSADKPSKRYGESVYKDRCFNIAEKAKQLLADESYYYGHGAANKSSHALFNARQSSAASLPSPAPLQPVDPLDWPLPCDIQIGQGTIKKGCKLRALVARTSTLQDMVHDYALQALADQAQELDMGYGPPAIPPGFKLVSFDPPHLVRAGPKSWLAAKYGKLSDDWREDIRKGFAECFRVLATDGVLVFKWNETQVKVREVLELTDVRPLFGHLSGRKGLTHWYVFMKFPSQATGDSAAEQKEMGS